VLGVKRRRKPEQQRRAHLKWKKAAQADPERWAELKAKRQARERARRADPVNAEKIRAGERERYARRQAAKEEARVEA
jgi:carbonic anhydrase